ncbi:hypothetical protein V6C27_07445 [Peptococcaceae bacterium 1198_IL3148]
MKRRPIGPLDKIEKILIRMVVVTAVTLVVVQALVVDEPFNTVMARVGTDTEPTATTVHWSEPRITLYLENYSALPHMSVLVNGNEVDVFDDRYVTVPVQHGDRVELDGTFYQQEIKVRVLNISDQIEEPLVDKQVIINSNVVSVCTVEIK